MEQRELFDFETTEIIDLLAKKNRLTVGRAYGSATSFLLRNIIKYSRPIIVISDEQECNRIARELNSLNISTLNLRGSNHPVEIVKGKDDVIIIKVDDLENKRFFDYKSTISIRLNDNVDLERFEDKLYKLGYHREYNVSEPFEYARRGGIIDFFPPDQPLPLRVEFDADQITSIREFDPLDQLSIRNIKGFKLLDADKKLSMKTIFEILPEQATLFSNKAIHTEQKLIIYMEEPGGDIDLPISPPRFYFGKMEALRRDLSSDYYNYVVLLPADTQIERLMNRIGDRRVLSRVTFIKSEISAGFIDEKRKVVYLTEAEVFGNLTIPRPQPRFKGLFIDDLLGMKIGDYVVHRDYGIGRYLGLTKLRSNQIEQECLLIEYAGGDRLYLSVEHINLIERYIGSKEDPPLSKLGGSWFQIKKKAKAKTEKYIIELLNLYARRSVEPGISFKPDYDLEDSLKLSFNYELTKDQEKAVEDVYSDMLKDKPMDRIVCGDVGYGKTEVAVRSAVRAVINGYQVAVLCPTTILALQHYRTFQDRLKNFPFIVEMLSRLVKRKDIQSILKRLEEHKIDILIGTHRILNPDVSYSKLGLLIIDDEHRFGVKQKEMIKKFRTSVDVLMLTATPLPRTLYMSLTGIRDFSVINSPPVGRQDIATEIFFWDDDRIRNIIWKEIDRGGQVFFIHNRIETIQRIRERLLSLLPEIKIAVIHSKIKEAEIAAAINKFINGYSDLLLSTSIIEAGIDMPNVNTIIVNQAHLFGLADLHQLRGRVGRSQIKGYAYFIIPDEDKLSLESKKRLSALSVYCNLGSGFRLAIRDMEIRGVGNILGSQQHGIINRIGYGLYTRLLKQTVAELKGKRINPEPRLDLKISAYIPEDYIRDSYERIAIYKRLFSTESKEELLKLNEELRDRFGKSPRIVNNLFDIAKVRLLAQQQGVDSVSCAGKYYIIKAGKIKQRIPKDVKKLVNFLEKKGWSKC